MGNGKQTISLQLFWMPNGCKAHSRVLMEWDQNILQRILHAAVKWECMVVQYIACNPSVAIPGPFYIPQQCGILSFHIYRIWKHTHINRWGQRREETQYFYYLDTLSGVHNYTWQNCLKKRFFPTHLTKWKILKSYQDNWCTQCTFFLKKIYLGNSRENGDFYLIFRSKCSCKTLNVVLVCKC